jgi:hypothetical protein
MIKKWTDYIKEDIKPDFVAEDDKYLELIDKIKDMIEITVENNGGEYSTFVDSYNKSPEDFQIEGLINDSDIYDFYLMYRNDIDEVLNDIKYFDEIPTENNSFGLYEYTLNGTKRTITEIIKML